MLFLQEEEEAKWYCIKQYGGANKMTLQQAMKKNPYDSNKGNLSAYARYIRYNVDGMYKMKSKDVQNLIMQKLNNK